VPPDARRDEAYWQIFAEFRVATRARPFEKRKQLKNYILMTVQESQGMTDIQLEPVLVICNLLLAGEGPTILKMMT